MFFLHNYIPNPYFLKTEWFSIHWYGFLMVVGGLIGFSLILQLAKFYKIKKDDLFDLLFYFVIGAIIGARIYYVFYAWEFYRDDLWSVFKIWEGGLAIHGIMLGGFLTTLVFSRMRKIEVWKILDLAAIGLVCAQIFGRWGNYFNQELFGKPVEWGIPISPGLRPDQYLDAEFFHPTFLYESLANILVLGLLLLIFKFFATRKKMFGVVFASYLILYSIVRFSLEFLRVDYSPEIFGVRWAMIVSGGLILAGGGLLVAFFCKKK